MEAIDQNTLAIGVILCLVGISSIVFTLKKSKLIISKATNNAKSIIGKATKEAESIISENQNRASNLVSSAEKKKKYLLEEAEQGVVPFHERVERLKGIKGVVTIIF
jgi:hypothetical protein